MQRNAIISPKRRIGDEANSSYDANARFSQFSRKNAESLGGRDENPKLVAPGEAGGRKPKK
jgi:hypothetical protein